VQSTKLLDRFPHQIKLYDVKTPEKVYNVVECGSNYPAKKSITLLKEQDFVLEAR